MAIGGSDHWTYDSGQWDETKEEPDLWKIKFEARKHRQRHAPKGSGAPVGTEYHWLIGEVAMEPPDPFCSVLNCVTAIVAHQYVVKEDEDTYSTRMEGRKYKLAHKSVGSNAWSIITGVAPVIGSRKVSTPKRKERGQRTLEQTIKGGDKKAKPEETKADISDGSE
ncbi:hypothetical protein V8E55_007616 [Tylopilus felleus]